MDAATLAQAFQHHPLDARIVRFFLGHTDAVDTLEGIADWWVQEGHRLTREALDRLVNLGVIVWRVRGGRQLFSFTTDPELRAMAEQCCSRQSSQAA